MMNKAALLTIILSLCAAPAALAQQAPVRLATGEQHRRTIGPEQEHHYTLDLPADRFVFGVADQQSVDVVVTITGPDGQPVGRFDVATLGREPFQFSTDQAGTYRVEIMAGDTAATGRYALVLKRVEPVAMDPAARVDQIMARYDNTYTPGAVIGVTRGDELVFAEAYGMANLTYGVPFTTRTRSNIGSVSKQFTAFAIALLADRGKLSLDDPIRTYVPELPQFADTIRIRNLLHHTSGLREAYSTLPMRGWHMRDELRRGQILALVERQSELQFEPGTKFVYNNTAYILLAEIVERVGGAPFDEWMDENVFDPLGMTHTTIKTEDGQIIAGRAAGYVHAEDGGYRAAHDLAESYGAGGIYTTIGDLAKWMDNFRTGELGGEAVIDQMLERGVLDNGDTLDYALGLFIDEQRGLERIQHGGADIAHRAMLAYYPELDAGVVVMSNLSSFDAGVAYRVAEVFFGEHMRPEDAPDRGAGGTVAVAPALLERYAGKYRMQGGGPVFTFSHEDGGLVVQLPGQPAIELVARSDSVFEVPSVGARVTFHADRSGPVQRATFDQAMTMTLHRIEPWSPTTSALETYTGRYYSTELQTYYQVALEDGQLVARNFATGDIRLTPTEVDSFSGSEFFFSKIDFERTDGGRVSGFFVSNGRTTDVWFERQ